MKKIRKIICIMVIILMASFICTACGKTYQEATDQKNIEKYSLCGNYFTIITDWSDSNIDYKIVYAKDKK